MITERFTIPEMEAAIKLIYPELMKLIFTSNKKYRRDFTKRKHSLSYPFAYSTPVIINYKSNRFVVIFGSPTKADFDFGCQIYLTINTFSGRRYYRIMNTGKVNVLSKHMVERFISRSNYPVNKENFLVYFAKETFAPSIYAPKTDGGAFMKTSTGMMVYKDQTYLTYLSDSDLSSNKQSVYEVMGEIYDNLDPEVVKGAWKAHSKMMMGY